MKLDNIFSALDAVLAEKEAKISWLQWELNALRQQVASGEGKVSKHGQPLSPGCGSRGEQGLAAEKKCGLGVDSKPKGGDWTCC